MLIFSKILNFFKNTVIFNGICVFVFFSFLPIFIFELCVKVYKFEKLHNFNIMVDEKLIHATHGEIKKYNKDERVVCEGDCSQYFYYLLEGELSVSNFTEEGKEFLQHKVTKNHFFGEPAVLLEKTFPGSVEVCSEKAKVLKIKRENFIEYMLLHPTILLEFTKSIAEKALRGSQSLKSLVLLNPEERILNQFNDYKNSEGNPKERILIPMTRKEISNRTGLRIETIIRTIKKMEKEEKLVIRNGKVYF